jgi:hypothetical protein
MSIQARSNYYVLTTTTGQTIKCHNLATAKYYLRLIKAGKSVS